MKKRVWRVHSWLGLAAGLGLLVIGLTGSLLVFRDEIDLVLGQAVPEVTPAATRAPLDDVVAKIIARYPDLEIFGWYANEDPRRADRISGTHTKTGEGVEIPFDPYTGALVENAANRGAFTGWLLGLHASLLLGTPGTFAAGVLAAALLASGLTGVYLYRDFWRRLFTLRWRASARIFFSDLHKMVGISSVAFNLILGFSGALWNLPAARDLFPATAAQEAAAKYVIPPLPRTLEAMKTAAQTALPGFQPHGLYYPDASGGYRFRGSVPTANPFASIWGNEVHFDPATGAVTRVLDLRKEGWWTRFQDMLEPLHFGTFGGLPIKLLWCLGGLAPGTLAVSGFLIWRNRRGQRPRRPLPGNGQETVLA